AHRDWTRLATRARIALELAVLVRGWITSTPSFLDPNRQGSLSIPREVRPDRGQVVPRVVPQRVVAIVARVLVGVRPLPAGHHTAVGLLLVPAAVRRVEPGDVAAARHLVRAGEPR